MGNLINFIFRNWIITPNYTPSATTAAAAAEEETRDIVHIRYHILRGVLATTQTNPLSNLVSLNPNYVDFYGYLIDSLRVSSHRLSLGWLVHQVQYTQRSSAQYWAHGKRDELRNAVETWPLKTSLGWYINILPIPPERMM